MTGSARGQPSPTPIAPSSTARLVKPSVRACSPSATSAAEPMRRPTRDAVAGDDLVAGEPDDRRGGDRPQVRAPGAGGSVASMAS